MRAATIWACAAVAFVSAGLVARQQTDDDDLLRAMRAELQRVKTLKAGEAGAPYYVEYALDDLESFTVSASMGGTLIAQHGRDRVPQSRSPRWGLRVRQHELCRAAPDAAA